MIIHQKNLIPHTIYRTHSQIILLFRFFSTPKHFPQQFQKQQNQLPNPNPTHSNTSSSKTFHRKMAPHSQLHATTSSPPAPTIKNAPKIPTSNIKTTTATPFKNKHNTSKHTSKARRTPTRQSRRFPRTADKRAIVKRFMQPAHNYCTANEPNLEGRIPSG